MNLNNINWNKDYNIFIEYLYSLQDKKYLEFHSKLVRDKNIIGIETHILDYNGDLYGQYVKVTFKEFLRPEMKFDSIDDLKMQMNKDKQIAKEYFNKNF